MPSQGGVEPDGGLSRRPVGAGLVSAAVADPYRADLVSRVCNDAIVDRLAAARDGD